MSISDSALEEWKRRIDNPVCDEETVLAEAVSALLEERAALREALMFYADPLTYGKQPIMPLHRLLMESFENDDAPPIVLDVAESINEVLGIRVPGERARVALALREPIQ